MDASDRITPSLAAEIDRLATAFAKDPRSKAFMPLAESYMKAGMWQEAAGVLEDGLLVYPGFVMAMAALGRAYDQLGQPAKAKAILQEVIKQSPDNLRAHRILAHLFSREGQAVAALKSCAAILAANPSDSEALAIQRSMALQPAEDHSLSETQALQPQPDAPLPQSNTLEAPGPLESPLASSISEDPSPIGTGGHLSKNTTTVARLEAWLTTIQARRRRSSPLCS